MYEMDSDNRSEIQEFYSGRSVFITGASGFLGKAVLEKLLRSCPNISNVYVLLRTKYGINVESRLKTVLQSPIFEILKQKSPSALNKVSAVFGDITLPNLGLSLEDKDRLCKTVSVVIHSAASVKFNEPLKFAMNINYKGTQRILDLCHDMQHLVVIQFKQSALVHVSTAYSNCDLFDINEEILAAKSTVFTPNDIDSLTDDMIAEITTMIIGNKPNTYSYAKSQAEILLKEQGGQIPIAIVRPSIIGAAWKEPQPGFVDSLNGMTGLIGATGKGMLTSMVCGRDKVSDVIPLDVTVNLIIACAWDTAKLIPIDIPVYNCCSGNITPITNGGIKKYVLETLEEYPFDNVIRYPSLQFVTSQAVNTFLNLCFNFLPFFLLDGVAVISRRKPTLLRIFNKVLTNVSSLTYFHMNEWNFQTDNMGRLENRMGSVDRELFFWNIKDMDWQDYFKNYCLGMKKWIFKEDLRNLSKAHAHRRRIYKIQKCSHLVVGIIIGLLFLRFFSMI